MRKILSFVLAVTIVFSCVALFSSCDKVPVQVDVSTTVSDTDTLTEETENITENAEDIAVTADQWYDEQPYIGPGTEHTTNSNYQKDYDELTLPPATSTSGSENDSAVEVPQGTVSSTGTTTKNEDKTTTTTSNGNKNDTTVNAPQFTTPSTNTTTKTDKTETTTKTSSNKETTKTTTTTTTTTTTSSDSGNGSGYVTPSEVLRPNVTYFDKYVKSVLNSGNYTATVTGTFQGHSATVNIYKNGGTAYKVSSRSFPVFRYFYSGGNVYIIVPAEASYAVVDVADPVVGMIESVVASESVAMTADGMTYCGVTSGTGFVCESYKDSDGTTYNYYFNDGGLTKIGVSGPSGNSTIGVSLRSGVSDRGVFSVPSGYRQVDVQEYIDRIES